MMLNTGFVLLMALSAVIGLIIIGKDDEFWSDDE